MKLKIYKSLLDDKMIMMWSVKVFVLLSVMTVTMFILFRSMSILIIMGLIWGITGIFSYKDPKNLDFLLEHYKKDKYYNP